MFFHKNHQNLSPVLFLARPKANFVVTKNCIPLVDVVGHCVSLSRVICGTKIWFRTSAGSILGKLEESGKTRMSPDWCGTGSSSKNWVKTEFAQLTSVRRSRSILQYSAALRRCLSCQLEKVEWNCLRATISAITWRADSTLGIWRMFSLYFRRRWIRRRIWIREQSAMYKLVWRLNGTILDDPPCRVRIKIYI